MAESIFEVLARLGLPPQHFCFLANISRDDLHAIDEGAALPSARVTGVLRLCRSTGMQKLASIVRELDAVMTTAQQWRAIASFPAYEVSDDGHVRRRTSSGKGALRTLKRVMTNSGYYKVTLYRSGHPEPQRIHRLVCETFNGPSTDDAPFVCHRNGDKTDNRAANLYWGSPKDNSSDWQRHRAEIILSGVQSAYSVMNRKELMAVSRYKLRPNKKVLAELDRRRRRD